MSTILVDLEELGDTSARFCDQSAQMARVLGQLRRAVLGLDVGCWTLGEDAHMAPKLLEAEWGSGPRVRARSRMGSTLALVAEAFAQTDMTSVEQLMGMPDGTTTTLPATAAVGAISTAVRQVLLAPVSPLDTANGTGEWGELVWDTELTPEETATMALILDELADIFQEMQENKFAWGLGLSIAGLVGLIVTVVATCFPDASWSKAAAITALLISIVFEVIGIGLLIEDQSLKTAMDDLGDLARSLRLAAQKNGTCRIQIFEQPDGDYIIVITPEGCTPITREVTGRAAETLGKFLENPKEFVPFPELLPGLIEPSPVPPTPSPTPTPTPTPPTPIPPATPTPAPPTPNPTPIPRPTPPPPTPTPTPYSSSSTTLPPPCSSPPPFSPALLRRYQRS